MTLTEKLLARAADRDQVVPGETLFAHVDVLMTHDVCGPGTIGVFRREFSGDARVWDAERVVLIPDHYIFTSDQRANRNVDTLREFAREQGIKYFYDVVDDADEWRFDRGRGPLVAQYGSRYAGVCHVALAEKGHTRPGEILVGTDSHTCTAGAFGQFATGIGNTDAAFVMGTGRILLRVPESVRVVLEGSMPPSVMAKDVILHLIGEIGFDGATYCALEFTGDGVAGLTVEDRMTIANMAIECGAKNGVFAADRMACDWVTARGREHGTARPFAVLNADAGARYAAEYRVDLAALEPTVALPHDPAQRAVARDCGHITLDRAYVGSCTGGKLSDFLAFAHVVRGREVVIDTFGVPATPNIVRQLHEATLGGRSVWDALVTAGVKMTENAGCAACLGGPSDTFGRANAPLRCISATNRNFPGRMGHPNSEVVLASPCTVAASALTG
ncbi:MAG: 3-isopropylmalate dehydratase, partial [Phycisphaerae bacterium]|nr:3-isopropylmalate dehydratase [Phycisphaerae bacterium]